MNGRPPPCNPTPGETKRQIERRARDSQEFPVPAPLGGKRDETRPKRASGARDGARNGGGGERRRARWTAIDGGGPPRGAQASFRARAKNPSHPEGKAW